MDLPRHSERGQAAVETALVMPLALFLILGALQLFLMYQARLLSHYAAFRSTRAGSVALGRCLRMEHAAIGALLPALTDVSDRSKLVDAFRRHRGNRQQLAAGVRAPVVWVIREQPQKEMLRDPAPDDPENEKWFFNPKDEYQLGESYSGEDWFDNPSWGPRRGMAGVEVLDPRDEDPGQVEKPTRLEVRMVFWYPLRIPFANWVISKIALASAGVQDWKDSAVDPLLATRQRTHRVFEKAAEDRYTSGSNRYWSVVERENSNIRTLWLDLHARRAYAFPIETSYAMRMMTPPRKNHFLNQNCDCGRPGAPGAPSNCDPSGPGSL